MANSVVDKIKEEYQKFVDECRKNGVEYAIQNAEEISDKKFILDTFENDYYGENKIIDLKKIEEKAILNTPNVLDTLYKDYKNHIEVQKESQTFSRSECVDVAVEQIGTRYKKEHEKTK